MRFIIFILSIGLTYSMSLFAEENQVPVVEPTIQNQNQDINNRLDRLERILENDTLLDMHTLLESLKTEVSALRGEIEVQTHTMDQIKQKQRDLYTDIDRRLQRLESGQRTSDSLISNSETAPTPVQPEVSTEAEVATTESKSVAEVTTEPTETTVAAVDNAKAESVYQRAFKLLRNSQYDQALVAFKDFLNDYPNTPYSDNAQYWLAETNYVTRNYEIAINEYQALLNTYPDSQKVSHALLKIGYSYAELGNASDAKKTLEEVMRLYPGTTAARLADERLRKIGSSNESNS